LIRQAKVNPKVLSVIDGAAALRSRNVATMRNFAQMVIVLLLGLFFRWLRTFSS
jgi:hypothetical protein